MSVVMSNDGTQITIQQHGETFYYDLETAFDMNTMKPRPIPKNLNRLYVIYHCENDLYLCDKADPETHDMYWWVQLSPENLLIGFSHDNLSVLENIVEDVKGEFKCKENEAWYGVIKWLRNGYESEDIMMVPIVEGDVPVFTEGFRLI